MVCELIVGSLRPREPRRVRAEKIKVELIAVIMAPLTTHYTNSRLLITFMASVMTLQLV